MNLVTVLFLIGGGLIVCAHLSDAWHARRNLLRARQGRASAAEAARGLEARTSAN